MEEVNSSHAASKSVRYSRYILKTIGYWVLLMAAGTILMAYLGLPLTSVAWHLRRGNSVQCGGFQIPVSRGWWPTEFEGGCELIQSEFTFHILHEFQYPVKAFFNFITSPYVEDKQWQQNLVNKLRRDGNIFRGAKELSVGGIPTLCLEWESPTIPARSSVACNVNRRMIVTFFCEDQKSKAQFYKILRGIQIVQPGITIPTEQPGIGARWLKRPANG
jgi:hypothetical protein